MESLLTNNSMKPLYPILFLFLLLLAGCKTAPTENNLIEFGEFQQEFTLKEEPMEWIEVYRCGGLAIFENLIVVIDLNGDHLFKVYNLDTKAFMGSFGARGKGPDEFAFPPEFTSVYRAQEDDLVFQVFDPVSRTVVNLRLEESINAHRPVLESKYHLPDELILYNVAQINDSLIVGTSGDVVVTYNIRTVQREEKTRTLTIQQTLSDEFNQYAHLVNLEPSIQYNRLVTCYKFMNRIHLFTLDGKLTGIFKEPGEARLSTSSDDIYEAGNKIYFVNTFIGKNHLLALNQNRKARENKPGELWLFDYQGNPLSKYHLDCWISGGAMDWRTGTFYATNVDEKQMISFNLIQGKITGDLLSSSTKPD